MPREIGRWVKTNPEEAAVELAKLWKIEPAIVRQANDRRFYRVEPATR